MKKAKCEGGHFFDLDRFPVCPLCGKPGAPFDPAPMRPTSAQEEPKTELLRPPVQEEPKTELLRPSIEEEPKAELIWRPEKEKEVVAVETQTPAEEEPTSDDAAVEQIPDGPAPKSRPEPDAQEWAEDAPVAQEAAPESRPESDAQERAEDAPPLDLPPVPVLTDRPEAVDRETLPVAWLVGISRPYLGRAFPCQEGRTRIGRSEAMDIQLPDAPSVSENLHAAVIYEPIKKEFFLQAGTENGLTYRNGNLIFSHDVLRSHDKIRLGAVEFVFLPLCGEHFSWDEYTNRE